MTIDLGRVQFDERELVNQLRLDMKDDWFPDPVNFRDILTTDFITKKVAENFDAHHGVYEPRKRSLFDIPKSNFTLRYALETDIVDRALYHGLVASLVEHFDPLIPWFVFNHRQNSHRSSAKYLFRNGVDAWKDYIETVRAAVHTDKHLLSTDITNYFEHIRLSTLRGYLNQRVPDIGITPQEKHMVRARIDMLFECLKRWCFEEERGLPQNRDASSFLANLYMLPVDEAMKKLGYEYYRYMDDIQIVCRDKFAARLALMHLCVELRRIGLAVNSKKTSFTPGDDRKAVDARLDISSPAVERLAAMWNSKARGPIGRSFPHIRALALDKIDKGEIDHREFRFAIGRLSQLARCAEFAVPDPFFRPITEGLLKSLGECPAASDKIVEYLRSVKLTPDDLNEIASHLLDEQKNFYDWQNYKLWLLLAEHKHTQPAALSSALHAVEKGADSPHRAGASVYAGAIGGNDERAFVAEKFKTLSSFLGQRSAIIATHELPFAPLVRDKVAPHVQPGLKGAFRALRTSKGVYVTPLEPVSITRFVELERDYA